MKVVSFIPIKLNNQRLPGKNTMMLNGRPMCDYLFETISEVDTIDEKYIYCSDEAIKPYISPYESKGLKFLKRDPYLDGFQVKGLEIIDRFIKDVDADIYVLTHVTQPFTKGTSIAKALEKVVSGEYDSAFSAVMLQPAALSANLTISSVASSLGICANFLFSMWRPPIEDRTVTSDRSGRCFLYLFFQFSAAWKQHLFSLAFQKPWNHPLFPECLS